jgi:hypothetical protein
VWTIQFGESEKTDSSDQRVVSTDRSVKTALLLTTP